MRTLFVGVGALGGVVAARLRGSGAPVWLATWNAESAAALRASGLRVAGVGGALSVEVAEVAAVDEYGREAFDLIVLATKAQDAIDVAPRLSTLLAPGARSCPSRTAAWLTRSRTGWGTAAYSAGSRTSEPP